MNLRGRTVILLICLSILLSSFVTMLVVSSGSLGSSESASSALEDDEPAEDQAQSNHEDEANGDSSGNEEHLRKIHEVYDIIMNNYVLDVDEDALLEGAIDGMLESLDDPYSVYMNTEEAQQFQSSFESSFEGIGAEVVMKDGRVTIVSPIRGSPAEEAGLRPNDQILSVNGEELEGLNLHQAVLKIKGPKGSEAQLEILRPGLSEPIKVTVIRDEIPLETVYADTIFVDGKTLGKLEITSFAQKTAERFEEELRQFEAEGIDGLIIDVRGNPGGYLDAVREIGQLLIPEEGIITRIENRDGEKMVYRSSLNERKPYPISIIIDNGSASASEILAAALQEAGDYTVVGETSFGKGTVQSAIELDDSSEVKITIAKWLTPDGNWIHDQGVKPDVEVSQPDYFRATHIATDPPLEKDMNNDQVQNLQIILQGLGYEPGRTDGFFSAETETAVKQFQDDEGLPQTGIVDEETALKMEEALTSVMMDEANDEQLNKAIEVMLEEIE